MIQKMKERLSQRMRHPPMWRKDFVLNSTEENFQSETSPLSDGDEYDDYWNYAIKIKLEHTSKMLFEKIKLSGYWVWLPLIPSQFDTEVIKGMKTSKLNYQRNYNHIKKLINYEP